MRLDDDPADSRGILSWHAQPHDRRLYEAGSYGQLLRVPLTAEAIAEAARTGEVIVRLEVDEALPGGLWDPESGRKRAYPWGDDPPTTELANLDQLAFGPAEIGAYPRGASAYGCQQMIGDVWEWVASDFRAYPGFRAFPYREYSEVFFGTEYKVLRGGSWAASPRVATVHFRNWDLPQRRQIFSGLRLARGEA